MNTTPPTCAQIFDEELGRAICREESSGWRHGVDRCEVYKRESDNTYWQVDYRVSTDGETNGLRDNEASISQVEPYERTITAYRSISAK